MCKFWSSLSKSITSSNSFFVNPIPVKFKSLKFLNSGISNISLVVGFTPPATILNPNGPHWNKSQIRRNTWRVFSRIDEVSENLKIICFECISFPNCLFWSVLTDKDLIQKISKHSPWFQILFQYFFSFVKYYSVVSTANDQIGIMKENNSFFPVETNPHPLDSNA